MGQGLALLTDEFYLRAEAVSSERELRAPPDPPQPTSAPDL